MNYEFKNLDNFRDLGGIPAADGKMVAPGRILRSGDLSRLTEEDIILLKEKYFLTNIVDFRTEHERVESPDCKIPGTQYFAMDFFPNESLEKSTGSEDQLKQMESAEQIHKNMKELYASFITDMSIREKLYEFLQLLLRTEKGSTLFHCFAGKDRTGIGAAVILTVLGVSKNNIIKDYLETNILRQKANKTIIDGLKDAGMPETMQEAVQAALSVQLEYLEISFETADREYGSFEEYIIQGIGLEKDKWEQLRLGYLI